VAVAVELAAACHTAVDEGKLIVDEDTLIVGADEMTVDKVTEADVLVEDQAVKAEPLPLCLSIPAEANVDHFDHSKEEVEAAVVEALQSTGE